MEQFVVFFIKIEQIFFAKSAFCVRRRPISANSRILFDYTDKHSELCIVKFKRSFMAEYEVYKSEAETASQQGREERSRQIYAELLCDFMFKRVFGSEENKDVLIAFLNVM